ncbi:HTH-type transcriptional regulator Hpr [Salirhabdus salicampi]|nr:HTH-type transcriptional regulator Hpr [Salirhabdus salicampi]
MENDKDSFLEGAIYSHKVAQLSKALWKSIERDWQEWVKPFNLNINEHHILWVSYRLGGSSISEISKFGVMHVSTAFNFSKKLEKRGLLTFSKRENDKRNTYVDLTDEGKKLLEETLSVFDPSDASIVKGSLKLKELYGKFPEFLEIIAIVREVYGDEYLDILNRTITSIEKDYQED